MKPEERRRKDLAMIHCAKRDLKLDDEVYRDVLWTVARVRSSAKLDAYGRGRVLKHFQERGWQPKAPKGAHRNPGKVRADREGYLSKITAQLTELHEEWSYADSIARRMFDLDSVRFCSEAELRKVVAALYYEIKRRAKRAVEATHD